jgi:signal transduction histidine kinase
MFRNNLKNPIFIFYLLVFYVFAQFIWWWYLIFKLNKSIYNSEIFYQKKIWMILGEGLVFFILLIFGIIAVRKAFKRQQNLAKKEIRLAIDQENFVLSVSHELKTPIASVQLFLQTLQKRIDLPEAEKNKIYTKALSEVGRLDSLVNNILLTKQIEKDDYPIQKAKVNLKDFIKFKAEIYEQIIAKNHKIQLNLQEVTAHIDQNAFDSILTNIIENAVKYSEPNTKIIIGLTDENENFILTVSDQGKGISAENINKLFNKFFREENELTRQTKGTGLGLYIVNFLVQKHKGSITIENQIPKGLIVKIKIPKK